MKYTLTFESFINKSQFNNKLNESSLNKPRLKVMADKKLYKELSQALKGATEIEDIWNQLDPKMFKVELDKFENIFNSWWNSNNSYDSISDFAKNATAEDVESLLIHILFSIHKSVELNESISAKDIKVGAEFKIGSDIFKVEKVENDKKFGQVVSSSRTNSDGKKYEYRDTMDEFISFLNDENAKLKN